MVQWLRIYLPMQQTWVQSLLQEDSTCHGAAQSMHYNYWSPPIACAPQREKPLQWEACTPQPEKAHTQQCRSSAAKTKQISKNEKVCPLRQGRLFFTEGKAEIQRYDFVKVTTSSDGLVQPQSLPLKTSVPSCPHLPGWTSLISCQCPSWCSMET